MSTAHEAAVRQALDRLFVLGKRGTHRPHFLAFLLAIRQLCRPLPKGLIHGLKVQLLNFLLSYVFGYNMGVKLRLVLFLMVQNPFSADTPGIPDMVISFGRWLTHDEPSPPSVLSIESVATTLGYYIPSIWVALNVRHFLRFAAFACGPVLPQALFWTLSYLLLGQRAREFVTRAVEWVFSQSGYYVPIYGIAAYILVLRGFPYALQVFTLACCLMTQFWPVMTRRQQTLFRMLAISPLVWVEFFVILPFLPVWTFRHILMGPYFRVRQKLLASSREFFRRSSGYEGQTIYEYNCLGEGEIRLLEVYRVHQQQLQCRIHHIKLKDAPQYDAISYMWGSPELDHGVLVNGQWLQIPRSAYDVLQDRASIYGPKLLWIDCICINQSDEDEKSFQVRMMSKIYQRATRVIVWLGVIADAEQAFSLLGDLYERICFVDDEHVMGKTLSDWLMKAGLSRHLRYAHLNKCDPRFAALARLLDHKYFSRVWVTQEIVFGGIVHVRCDGSWIDWTRFAGAVNAVSDDSDQRLTMLAGVYQMSHHLTCGPWGVGQIRRISFLKEREWIRELHRELGEKEEIEKPRLCDLLAEIGKAQSSDPRDMIYGYLNLSREANIPEFAPDYKKTTNELYIELAHLFLQRNELFNIMYMAGIGYPRNLENLPSWVPDWTSVPQAEPLSGRSKASYEAPNGVVSLVKVLTPRMLSVRGVYLDKIRAIISEPLGWIYEEGSSEAQMHKLIAQCHFLIEAQDLASTLPEVYVNAQPRSEAFWRTLIGDTMLDPVANDVDLYNTKLGLLRHGRWNLARPASDEYGILFDAWRRYSEIVHLAHHAKEDDVTCTTPDNPDRKELKDSTACFRETVRSIQEDGRFGIAFFTMAQERKFAITRRGFMAMVPPLARTGDEIGIIYGAPVPFVLRRCSTEESTNLATFRLVGECYVHGIMDGEALQQRKGNEMDFILS